MVNTNKKIWGNMENMGKWQNETGMESILIFVFLVNNNINAS